MNRGEDLIFIELITQSYVLPTVIDRRAVPSQFPDDYLVLRRKKGVSCPRCGSALEQVKVSGRTAYLCPGCQKK